MQNGYLLGGHPVGTMPEQAVESQFITGAEALRFLVAKGFSADAFQWDTRSWAGGSNGLSESLSGGAVLGGAHYCEIETTATSGRFAQLFWGNKSPTVVQQNATGDEWAAASRFAIVATPTANIVVEWGIGNVLVGIRGTLSTTHFTLYVNGGTNIVTTKAFDTDFHEWIVYRLQGMTYVFCDGLLVGQSATAFPSANGRVVWHAFNGATAANMRIQWTYGATMAPIPGV